jgi:lipid-A-disaccharide synthase
VVAYRLAQLSYWLAKLLVHIPYFSLPNLLAQEQLVPEFLQQQVLPDQLGLACLHWLENPSQVEKLTNRFADLHHCLRLNASQQAAQAVLSVISG